MATKEWAGKTLEVDDQGFLLQTQEWDDAVATAIAAEMGISELTEDHWRVVRHMRNAYLTEGVAPSLRSLGTELSMKTKQLYGLFPDSPARDAAKVAGIPKPESCI